MSNTRRLLDLARNFQIPLGAVIVFGLTGGLLTIWQAALLSRVINNVFLESQALGDVQFSLVSIILIILLRSLLVWGGELSASRLAAGIKNHMREFLFARIIKLGPAYTRTERTGELANTLTEGVEALDAYFSQYLPQLVIAAIFPLAILVFVFPRDPLSGFVLLLTGPLIPLFMYLIGKSAEALTQRQWGTLSLLGAHFLDSLQGLRTLKEFGRSQAQAASIDAAGNRFRDITLKVLRVTFLSALVLELVGTLSTAIIAVEIGLRLLYGHLGFQEALFLLLLAPEFYLPLRTLGLRFHAGMAGTAAAKRIFEIMDADERPITVTSASKPQETSFTGLRIVMLSYAYPGENSPVLQNINLQIKSGEHVALVGPTGAGKSTLAALLLGFLEPSEGQIYIKDAELAVQFEPRLNEYSLEKWRRQFAWVPQNPYIFNDTITANLRLGKADASQAELESAARQAHLDNLIAFLPQGYETVLGEAGARLSGGEAQRLALARAFLRNAPILILDEPTSSLDPESEAFLSDSTHSLMQGRTVITIAHRMNTVYQADRIYVLDGGTLIEVGDHKSLIAAKGLYSTLVQGSEPGYFQRVSLPAAEIVPGSLAAFVPTGVLPAVVGKNSTVPIMRRLLSFLRGSWGMVALSVILGALTVGSNVGLMATSAFLISTAALHPGLGALQVAIVGVRFFGLSRGFFRYTERLVSHDVTFRLLARLRSWFYRALEPLAPARLMQYRSGDLLSRVIADVETLENFYVRAVAPPLAALMVTAAMMLFFGSFNLRLALIDLAFMVLLGLFLPLFSWFITRRPGKEMVDERASLQSRLVDGLQGLPDLLAFDAVAAYSTEIKLAGSQLARSQLRLASRSGISAGLSLFLTNLGMLAILIWSISLVEAGTIPGTLLAVLALAALAGFEIVMPLPQAAQSLASSRRSAQRLFDVVDAPAAVTDPPSPCPCPDSIPSISFSDVCFTYAGQGSEQLSRIELGLPPGKHLAVVGPSGAGKSTLANLLLRFWDYDRGQILLDSQDLRNYSQEDIRSLISVVPQRSHFFNASIRENLLLARPGATVNQMREAASLAQIDAFIQNLPQGYETIIGERGLRLSGGERQRLALARAFLKDAPIFLLDEPTANLDPITEKSFLQALFNVTKGRSLILITHRLVQLEQMDEIVVLQKGRIVDRGTQAELLAKGGLFSHMWVLERRMLLDKNSPKNACGPPPCVL